MSHGCQISMVSVISIVYSFLSWILSNSITSKFESYRRQFTVISDFEPKIGLASIQIKVQKLFPFPSSTNRAENKDSMVSSLEYLQDILAHFEMYQNLELENGQILERSYAAEFDGAMNSDFCKRLSGTKYSKTGVDSIINCPSKGAKSVIYSLGFGVLLSSYYQQNLQFLREVSLLRNAGRPFPQPIIKTMLELGEIEREIVEPLAGYLSRSFSTTLIEMVERVQKIKRTSISIFISLIGLLFVIIWIPTFAAQKNQLKLCGVIAQLIPQHEIAKIKLN